MEGSSEGSGSEKTILEEREQDKGIYKRREHRRGKIKDMHQRRESEVSLNKEEQGTRKPEREENTDGAWKQPYRRSTKTTELSQTRKILTTTALTRNKAQLFPTTRRPEKREVLDELSLPDREVENWFRSNALNLGERLTASERAKAMRMLYTWRDVFETDLLRIRQTDLIEHAIVLMPGAVPHRARIPLYTEEEIAFCRRINTQDGGSRVDFSMRLRVGRTD